MAQSRRALLQGSVTAALGVAVAAPAVAVQPTPDAELIALCEEFCALDREWCRLCNLRADLLPGDPREDEIEAQQDALKPRTRELRDEIACWTAETPKGARALMRAARHTLSSDARKGAIDVPPEAEIAWAAIESALALLDGGRALA